MDSTLEYESTEAEPDVDASPKLKYEIFSYPADTTLKGYRDQWNNKQLEIPNFQRAYVWDQTRASKLIESFLLGLPVPPVFLYKMADTKSFQIIDGQQRITSIVRYMSGLFNDAKFKLKGVSPDLEGKSFSDLTENQRFALETTVLRAIVIQQTNPADHSSIYHVFERLNTGGVRLNPMEVRRCVYEGQFLDSIKLLNDNRIWRDVIGLPAPDKRLKDQELILRVLSLFRDFENYEKPMKGFLNDCAAELKARPSSVEISRLETLFENSVETIIREIGSKPFHLKGRLNFGALDAVMVAIMRLGQPIDLSSKFATLVTDNQFQEDISFNTSDESVLKRRINKAISVLA